jgi:transcription elongation GreA/GreB family factor
VDEARHFARRILQSPVFDELSRRSLIGHIIKVCPEVQDLLTGAKRSSADEKLVVSWDSLEVRKLQLEEIVSVKIPANKREIQIAREYGDLRENFEFKAAKQQQAVLNRQRTVLESEMKNARGTDFANPDTSAAGIGTVVDVKDTASGETETFTILGAWDTDVERGILSYLTAAAQALIGHSVGEKVQIPTDEQDATEREVEITGIRAYVTAAADA